MVKTLVTTGYHLDELGWGREVRKAYLARNLQGNRDLNFYEFQNSNVDTGAPCKACDDEIKKVIADRGIDLWTDIHCGIFPSKDNAFGKDGPMTDMDEIQKMLFVYCGNDDDILQGARLLEKHCKMVDQRQSSSSKRLIGEDVGIPYACIDAFFINDNFHESKPTYQNHLNRTIQLINRVHDLHLPKAPSSD